MLKIVSIDDNLYRISFERPKKKNGGANRVTICRVEKIEPAIENNPPVIDSCVAISFCNKTDLEKRGFNYDIGRRQALFKALHNHLKLPREVRKHIFMCYDERIRRDRERTLITQQ